MARMRLTVENTGTLPTDMGRASQKAMGRDDSIFIPLDTAVTVVLRTIDDATREESSGRFLDAEKGFDWPW